MFQRIASIPSLFASTSRARAYSVRVAPASKGRKLRLPPAKAKVVAPKPSPKDVRQTFTSPLPAPAPTTPPAEPATHYRITLMRSALGLPSYARDTLAALGLRKRMQHVYHPFAATTAGQILRVKELVKVENVPEGEVKSKEVERMMRRPSKGFEVLGKAQMPWAVKDEGGRAAPKRVRVEVQREQAAQQVQILEECAADVNPNAFASSSSSSASSLTPAGARTFHTSSIARSEPPIAPVLPEPLTHESTPAALKYLDDLTADSIPRTSCVVEFSRSSGPGGQNVNKLNTKATLRMTLKPLPKWVPAWCENGMRSSKEYAQSSNSIVIQSMATRSQSSNVDDCFRKLHALVDHHARSVLVPVPDEEKKKRVQKLIKREKERTRAMKDAQKSRKASRRGPTW